MQKQVKTTNNQRIDKPDFDALQDLVADALAASRLAYVAHEAVGLYGLHVKADTGRNVAVYSPNGIAVVDASGRLYKDNASSIFTVNIGPSTSGYILARFIETDIETGVRVFWNSETGAEENRSVKTRTRRDIEIAFSTSTASGDWFALAAIDTSSLAAPSTSALTDACIENVLPVIGERSTVPGFTTLRDELSASQLPVNSYSGFDPAGGRALVDGRPIYYRALGGSGETSALTGVTNAHEGEDAYVGRAEAWVVESRAHSGLHRQMALMREMMRRDRGVDYWAEGPHVPYSSVNANTTQITVGDGVRSKGHINNEDLGIAIEQAILLWPTVSGNTTGVEIYVKPGVYKLGHQDEGDTGELGSGRLNFTTGIGSQWENITIRGAGKDSDSNGGTKVLIYDQIGGLPIILMNNRNCTIRDINFVLAENYASDGSGSALLQVDGDYCALINCSILGSPGGFHVGAEGSSGSGNTFASVRVNGDHFYAENCTFDELRGSAIEFAAASLHGEIRNCTFDECGPVLLQGEDQHVRECKFKNTRAHWRTISSTAYNFGYAVMFYDCTYSGVHNCDIDESDVGGIGGLGLDGENYMRNIDVKDNVIRSCDGKGVYFRGYVDSEKSDRAIQVAGNHIRSTGGYAIHMESIEMCDVRDNHIEYPTTYGIYIGNSYTSTGVYRGKVVGNTIANHTGTHIKLSGADKMEGIRIDGNVLRYNGASSSTKVIHLENATSLSVNGNIVDGMIYADVDSSVFGDNRSLRIEARGNGLEIHGIHGEIGVYANNVVLGGIVNNPNSISYPLNVDGDADECIMRGMKVIGEIAVFGDNAAISGCNVTSAISSNGANLIVGDTHCSEVNDNGTGLMKSNVREFAA